ncbi:hypothetical protein D1818_10970 [Aquimarina sp. BL5]|uniref:hypothetical protein n=1 Tax=Aquimarina sp. BL5 TaxID=1714860 RepID=UPI000E4F308D|nr:hypothetical protein [Aquimarina sp. BL5]AXT51327.1 hypothetical protein D1818_10970 [Aquimarina sp. BL5]RKN09883.1 hypothetical protein D7036_03680 [Aquimarina sp. BL5]
MENSKALKGYYDFSRLFTATKTFIDTHNRNHDQLTKRLNANHRATAELITRLYAKQLNQAITLGEDITESLPGFTTFNPSLASCKGCTVRTIINHKERLKAAGFITNEIHRGKSGIELWINPSIFQAKKVSTIHNNIQIIKEVYNLKVKNFHPLVHEQQELKNNNSSVNKLTTKKEGVRLSAHRQEITAVTGTPQEQHKNIRESRNSASKKQEQIAKSTNAKEVDSAFLLQLVRDFWNYTRILLYPDIKLSQPEETEILNAIWSSVYRKFKITGSKKDWEGYQEILYKRIDMVSRWLERNPSRWIPPPHLYFNPENKRNGFNKTYEWFLKQELLKKEIRNQILIQKTEYEWNDHKKGKGRHKNKTRLQLFRIQQQRLSQYKDDRLLSQYEKSLHKVVNT